MNKVVISPEAMRSLRLDDQLLGIVRRYTRLIVTCSSSVAERHKMPEAGAEWIDIIIGLYSIVVP